MVVAATRLSALVLLGLCVSSFAGTDSTFDQIVVTATRTPEPAGDVLASVTVIDRAQIEARQATSVQELLQGEAGIEWVNDGGLGKVTTLFMRGTQSDHVLVLIDGVKIGSATVGLSAFQYIPVEQIDHIEIVRGPRSSLYGSDAMGGVIQIFTRHGSGEFTPEVSIAGGTHATRQTAGSISGSSDRISYSLSGNYQSSDGFNSCTGKAPLPDGSGGAGCFTFEPDADGYRNASASARVTVRPTDVAEIEMFVLHSKGATDFDGSFGNHENFVQQSAGIAARWSPNRDFRLSARAGESKDEATDDENGVYQSAFNTKRLSATVQADWTVAPHQALNVGADYLHDSVDGNDLFDGPGNVYPVSARRDTAVFAQYNGEFGPQHVVMSARRDDNQQFGGKATGSAAWGYRFADAIRFTATFGSAFKAPTFNELYYPFFGNPNLKPESSHSFELGLDQRRTWGQWSIHAYETHITDLIASDANFTAANIDKTRIRGLEFEVGGKFSACDWRATATSLDPRNLSERPGQGSTLLRRAKQTALLELGYGYRELRFAGRLNIQGPRFDDLANTQVIGGFTTIDVLVNWRITRQLSLQAKLANVADRHYQTALYYPQDGRNYLLTLRFAP